MRRTSAFLVLCVTLAACSEGTLTNPNRSVAPAFKPQTQAMVSGTGSSLTLLGPGVARYTTPAGAVERDRFLVRGRLDDKGRCNYEVKGPPIGTGHWQAWEVAVDHDACTAVYGQGSYDAAQASFAPGGQSPLLSKTPVGAPMFDDSQSNQASLSAAPGSYSCVPAASMEAITHLGQFFRDGSGNHLMSHDNTTRFDYDSSGFREAVMVQTTLAKDTYWGKVDEHDLSTPFIFQQDCFEWYSSGSAITYYEVYNCQKAVNFLQGDQITADLAFNGSFQWTPVSTESDNRRDCTQTVNAYLQRVITM